jgi:putative alpha-1,2-mannosidase
MSDGAVLTLAYAKTDAALADFATAVGQAYDAALYRNRSAFFANVFEPRQQFFCPRFANGTFACPAALEDELDWHYYTEGDAYNYRFDAAQWGDGEVALFGGADAFVKALNDLFERSVPWDSTVLPCPFYWAGNEEDLAFPWMFHNARAAPLTTKA